MDDSWLRAAVEYSAAFATAVLALIAAFRVNGTRRSRAWLVAPIVSLAIWIGAVAVQCAETWQQGQNGTWQEGAECFGFLIGWGTIIALAVLIPLYRARPRASVTVVALAGLGVAAAAATLLQFVHHFAVTVMDVSAHGAAIALLIAASMWSRRLVPQQI